jgi:hypothetical protein
MVKKGTSIKFINLTGKKLKFFKCRMYCNFMHTPHWITEIPKNHCSDMETADFKLLHIPSK